MHEKLNCFIVIPFAVHIWLACSLFSASGEAVADKHTLQLNAAHQSGVSSYSDVFADALGEGIV